MLAVSVAEPWRRTPVARPLFEMSAMLHVEVRDAFGAIDLSYPCEVRCDESSVGDRVTRHGWDLRIDVAGVTSRMETPSAERCEVMLA
jgi:hypothetical protein